MVNKDNSQDVSDLMALGMPKTSKTYSTMYMLEIAAWIYARKKFLDVAEEELIRLTQLIRLHVRLINTNLDGVNGDYVYVMNCRCDEILNVVSEVILRGKTLSELHSEVEDNYNLEMFFEGK